MIIPKGLSYKFNINVKEKDSFLAQDLTNMSEATFNLINRSDMTSVLSESLIVPGAVGEEQDNNALNGKLQCELSALQTSALLVARGDKEDNYYLKANYQGAINITFNGDTPDINVLIDKIYVAPTGN
jgi:hypothetical protein